MNPVDSQTADMLRISGIFQLDYHASVEELSQRWLVEPGLRIRRAIHETLAEVHQQFKLKATGKEPFHIDGALAHLMTELPFGREVSPKLDFRWLELDSHATLFYLDLSGAHLEGLRLGSGGISRCMMQGAVLDHLHGPGLRINAQLDGASLRAAELSKANLSYLQMPKACLDRAQLRQAKLAHSIVTQASFVEANLQEADLSNTAFHGADLSGADLRGANLRDFRWDKHTRFQGARILRADCPYDLVPYAEAGGVVWE